MLTHIDTCRHISAHVGTYQHMSAHIGTCRHISAHVSMSTCADICQHADKIQLIGIIWAKNDVTCRHMSAHVGMLPGVDTCRHVPAHVCRHPDCDILSPLELVVELKLRDRQCNSFVGTNFSQSAEAARIQNWDMTAAFLGRLLCQFHQPVNGARLSVTQLVEYMMELRNHLLQFCRPGTEVTKVPFVNFSVNKIFDLAKVLIKFLKSHSYLSPLLSCGDTCRI